MTWALYLPASPPYFEGLVQRLTARQPLHLRQLGQVFGGGRFVGERLAVALQQAAEVGADRRLQRGQHLVDLHRGRRVGDRDRSPASQFRRARAARIEFEEVVAFEEDPRPDRGEGVLVDRATGAFDGEGDGGRVAVAFGRGHLADVDAGDPHRRLDRDIERVAEGGVDLVAVAGERDVFGEREVRPDREDQDEDQGDQPVGDARLAAAALLGAGAHSPSPPFALPLVVVPQTSGDSPITVLPVTYFSLPASQPRV